MEQHRHVAFLRFEATVQLQIEPAGKILGRSVTFGPKSVENSSDLDNFFELTTPTQRRESKRIGTHFRTTERPNYTPRRESKRKGENFRMKGTHSKTKGTNS